eukprot:scaffold23711_cov133-Isochrysis_galbana.AAC.2
MAVTSHKRSTVRRCSVPFADGGRAARAAAARAHAAAYTLPASARSEALTNLRLSSDASSNLRSRPERTWRDCHTSAWPVPRDHAKATPRAAATCLRRSPRGVPKSSAKLPTNSLTARAECSPRTSRAPSTGGSPRTIGRRGGPAVRRPARWCLSRAQTRIGRCSKKRGPWPSPRPGRGRRRRTRRGAGSARAGSARATRSAGCSRTRCTAWCRVPYRMGRLRRRHARARVSTRPAHDRSRGCLHRRAGRCGRRTAAATKPRPTRREGRAVR